MKKSTLAGTLCAGLLVAVGASAAPPPAAAIAFHTCQIRSANGLRSEQARCGTLSVPENRAQPDGKQIELFVAVLPALAANPKPDPLFFIAGGPGGSAVDGYFSESGAFDFIRKQRDIVLLDQRGTGQSHSLDCPAQSQILGVMSGLSQPTPTELARLVKQCLANLNGDPRYYTTSVAIADLDAVRAALGADKINVYGVSYGTRVALEYLRYYGAHVRSVVLDGVMPADRALGPRSAVYAERALNGVFARCARHKPCATTFPALPAEFKQLNQRLQAQPAKVTLPDPLTAKPSSLMLTQQAFALTVMRLTYKSETTSLLPLLIDQAVRGNLEPLARLATMINHNLEQSGLSPSMYLSVLCTEDVPFYGPNVMKKVAARHTYLGDQTLGNARTACGIWPHGVIRPRFKMPVVSKKPVLLLSGSNDPATPPANAAHAAKTLANSLSIVVAGQGHGNAWRGCLPQVMAAFIAAASVKSLDTACVKRIRPAAFCRHLSSCVLRHD